MKKNIYMLLFSLIIIVIITVINKFLKNENTSYISSGRTIVIDNNCFSMQMDMEQFIPLVLMAEMPFDSPKELVKAQAVIIRTNILYVMGEKRSITANQLGLPFKTPGQLKELWFQEEKLMHANGIRGIIANLAGLGKGKIYSEKMSYLYDVIRQTEGKVLKIEGKVILPLFHEVSNGKTRNGKEVLGDDYKYLQSVTCDEDMEYEKYSQSKKLKVSEILNLLKKHGIVVFKDGVEITKEKISAEVFLKMLDMTHKDHTGYISYFILGDVKIDGNDFTKALGLASPAMDVECQDGQVEFTTRGVGHGFGMSINYAKMMAEKGKSYEDILGEFYDAALVKNSE